MQYTENYSMNKPQFGENALVTKLNENADTLDTLIYNTRQMQADTYDSTQTYNTGDLVSYNSALYRCLADNVTGTWDATKWAATNLAEEVMNAGGGESALADLEDVEITNPSTGQALLFDDDDDVWKNQNLPDVSVTKEASGNPIELTDAASAPLVKCVTQITGYQSGTGTPSPDNIRPITAYTENTISVGSSRNLIPNGTDTSNGYVANSWINNENVITAYTPGVEYVSEYFIVAPNTVYTASQNAGLNNAGFCFYDASYNYITGYKFSQQPSITITTPSNAKYCRCSQYYHDYIMYQSLYVQFEYGSTVHAYENYVTPSTHTTTYPSAIYRGSEDCVKGEVITEWGMIASYNGETLPGEWISDRDEYVSGTTPTTGAQVAYVLATPTTSSVTPTNLPIKSLSGYTHIESSTGEMEVEYITEEYQPLVDLIQSSKHVYSTQEQIVGKWIDGRPIYERTFVVPNFTANNVASSGFYEGVLNLSTEFADVERSWGCIDSSYIELQDTTTRIVNFVDTQNPKQPTVQFLGATRTGTLTLTMQYIKATVQTRSLSAPLTSQKAQIEPLTEKEDEVPTEEEKAVNEEENNDETR